MFRLLKDNKAQAVMGEYVLTFFLVIGVMSAMTIYLKRALQGQIYSARDEMANMVATRASGQYTGRLYVGYEPYYLNSVSTLNRVIGATSVHTVR